MLDDLIELSGETKTCLFQQQCSDHIINVFENETHRWLTLGGDFVQSLIKLSAPDEVLLPYARSMLLGLLFPQKPLQLLNLGAGCGTFERFLFQYYPDVKVTSVETDSDIVKVARQYFYMPTDHPVINSSAELFLQNNKSKYDVIFCDLHNGKTHPRYLCDLDFYSHALQSLNEDGVLVINLIPASERDLLEVLLPVRKVFKQQYLLAFDHYKNILLFVSSFEFHLANVNNAACETLKTYANLDLKAVCDRLTLLPAMQPT